MHAGTYECSENFTRGEYEFKQFKASSNLLPSLSFLTIFLVAATK